MGVDHVPDAGHTDVATEHAERDGRRAAARFARFCQAVSARLPFGLSRLIPATFVGFALINGFTFGLDLLILTGLHGWLQWPVGVSITIGYAVALGINFLLNRILNFRSHGPVGRQLVLFVGVIAINFGVILLGVGAGLAALGVQYQFARLLAGACEGVFMYCALRWVVFRDRSAPAAEC